MDPLSSWPVRALLVSVGAIPGACLRYGLLVHLAPRLPRTWGAAASVNLLACLLLGLVLSGLSPHPPALRQPVLLLLATGFLGSLSTFSTWMLELLQALEERQLRRALAGLLGPLLAGLLALAIGEHLGRVLLGGGR